MIDAIVGPKGTGKTAKIVDEITKLAQAPDTNIVCIENGKRFDQHLPYTVRLIDVTEYSIQGFNELFAFIAGMNAKDYDISHIYIDSIHKVARVEGNEGLAEFIKALDELAAKFKVKKVVLTISDEAEQLPKEVQEVIRVNTNE